MLYQQGVPGLATYRFKHALIQEAAYQSLRKRTRQQYHGRIAQVLQDEGYIQGFRLVEEPAQKVGCQARQVIRLFPEVAWVNGFRLADPGIAVERSPVLLAPMAAILGDTLYVGTLDAHLVALDARSGALRFDVAVASNALPVCSANACMSDTEPGSVAMTRRTWPEAMSLSDFLVFTMGMGQARPDASNSLSNFMGISRMEGITRDTRLGV